MKIAGVELRDARPVNGGDICRAFEARTLDGGHVFAKTLEAAPSGLFVAEARGLEMLRIDAGPSVPSVVAVGDDGLVLNWVEPGRPTRAAASQFGRDLACLHRAGSAGSGSTAFGSESPTFVATVRFEAAGAADWPTFYAEHRLRPALAKAAPSMYAGDVAVVDEVIERIHELAGPAEPPARVHGDLWSGNLLWGADGKIWLIDAAAAHAGHREADLAMLALFGAPMLDNVLAAYNETFPLATGWQQRVALHQVFPLLIHTILFGGSYGAQVAAAARAALT